MNRPYLVVAADWSKSWEGRWLAEAVREDEGYSISHPRPVGPPERLVGALLELSLIHISEPTRPY